MKNIIFLDIDGVLNCQIFYESQQFKDSSKVLNNIENFSHKNNMMEYYETQICRKRVKFLNDLCKETDSAIVVSSTWRHNHTLESLQNLFKYFGGTFQILDKTGHCDCENRGCEIHKWIKANTQKYFETPYYDFYNYAIIDDDSDMLLGQQNHFFQTDSYSGLTPNTCYKIKRFLLSKRT